MERIKLNYWIDAAMAVSLIITGITSLVMFFILPSGKRSGYEAFLGIIKQDWVAVHTCIGIIFLALMVTHLALHCKWLVEMTKRVFGKKESPKIREK